MRWIGQNMKRVEDPRLLTGRGKYIDDMAVPNMAHAAVLRSPYAHARIVAIDVSRARALPGVLLVLTGAEAAEQTGPLPCFSNPPTAQYCIATDRVRHVGEAVVAVVAESRYIAEDAIDLIDVEYEPLPVVVNPEDALTSSGDAVLHPERGPNNIALQRKLTFGSYDEDMQRADVIVRRKARWPRSGAQPMETVGAIASYDEGTGKFTVYANTSMYNYVGWLMAVSLNVSASKLNLIPTIAGGSFGSKLFAHKVPVLAATLARACGRPVKYLEDRLDNMMSSDNHGSDRIYDLELGLKRDGTMLAFGMRVIDDYGAYLQFGVGHHGNAAAQLTGPYRINSAQIDLTAVFTNKCQQGAYRGFGSEVNNFVLERIVDAAADELGLDPVEIRRKNFIQPEQFPYKIPTGNVYDSGNYEAVLDKALEMADYTSWRAQQAELRKQGRYIGIGLVSCQERSVFSSTEFWFWNHEPGFALTSSPESVNLRIDPTGKAFVTLYAPFWGNSPETMATQIVAEQLTIDPADIEVTYADTDQGLLGTGPGGSRYTVMIAGAIGGAAVELKQKLFKIAGHLLEASEHDLELREGRVNVRGTDRGMSIPEIAMQAYYFRLNLPADVNSGLDARFTYDHPYTTQPSADRTDLGVFYPIMGHMCHIPIVEVDIETGRIEYLKYVAVHDCGTVVNPMTLAGHVRGGTAQGIGSAMYEHFYYNEQGQLVTANFADYLIPTLKEVPPNIEVGHVETKSPFTEYGIKGGGEGGRMGVPPALAAAIEDALRPFGVKVDGLPITPMKIRELIRAAQQPAG
ncbi:MAG: xanthine dehydrogenase family protein molybdopterin-binding subunit [Kouleothrix sp.]|jgi:CO/xanthine dehydrogenase Mo-binding subunit|nr:xanthine dehydrogenase family protein molybdopterin-binding subunit [Kouleothrix sp.]